MNTSIWTSSSSTLSPSVEMPPPPPPILLREHDSYANSVTSTPGNVHPSTQSSNPAAANIAPSFFLDWLGTWTWPNIQQQQSQQTTKDSNATNPPEEQEEDIVLQNEKKNITMERTASSSSSNATSIMTEDVNNSFEWPVEEEEALSSDDAPCVSLSNVPDNDEGSKRPRRTVFHKRRILVVCLFLGALVLIVAAVAMAVTRSSQSKQAVSAASRGGEGPSPSSNNNINNNNNNNHNNNGDGAEPSSSSPTEASGEETPNDSASAPGTAVVVRQPTASPTAPPTGFIHQIVPFGAVGDVPYTSRQQERLMNQILNLDASTIDFLVHVGDIRNAEAQNGQRPECVLEEYEEVAQILRRSPVPVFILMGAWI